MASMGNIAFPQPPINGEFATEVDHQVFEAVGRYLSLEWTVLPFKRGDGMCYLTKAEAESFTIAQCEIASKFAGFDVGIDVRSSGLIDVDIDCPEAALLANWLLPETATFGRSGKLISHMLFKCGADVPTRHFNDLDGKELIALLRNSRLALPPSCHPKSGTQLSWIDESTPATPLDATAVGEIVGQIAALAMIARHWPGPHARHAPTMALAGMLARNAWPLDKALEAVKLISKLKNDEHLPDREKEVKSTYQRFGEGDKYITGLPTLAKLLTPDPGQAAALEQKVRDWLALAVDHCFGSQPTGLSKYLTSVNHFLALKEPEIEYLVDPILPKASLSMVFAARGVGKTWFTMHLALCLNRGTDFFAWAVPKARRVLLIDGEMQPNYLQFRLRALLGSEAPPPGLQIISVARMWREGDALAINESNDQQRIEQILGELEAHEQRPDLIILDNLSSLVVGLDENSNSELDTLLRWQIKLRSAGYAVLTVHHSGKNKEQRGASRREDLLDTVIKLEAAEGIGASKSDGANFDIQFTKLRGERPKPDRLRVALARDESGNFTWNTEGICRSLPAYLKVAQAIYDYKPASQAALVQKLGISKQAVNKQVKIAQGKGLVDASGVKLTSEGCVYMKATCANQSCFEDNL